MIVKLIALTKTESNQRIAGTIQAAYEITDDKGNTGLAYQSYEWDKRDVVSEYFYAEENIAAYLIKEIPEEGPMILPVFYNDTPTGDYAKIEEAREKATVTIYSYD